MTKIYRFLKLAGRLTDSFIKLAGRLTDYVMSIRFTREPESRVVPPGDRVFFNCRTNTGQDEEIYWLHNGHQLDPSKRSDVRISNGQLSIKIRTAKRHRERQTGSYQCVGGFENMLLMSNPAQLTVAYLDRFPNTVESNEVEGNEGNNILLTCTPPASDPPPIIQWFKETKLLNLTDKYELISNKNLFIRNISQSDAGTYACQASNHLTGESVLSPSVHNLTVQSADELHKPRLLYEPESSYHPQLGSDLVIPCSASGSPKPTIFWTHHAFNAPPTFLNGSDGLLQLVGVSMNSSGEYTCQIFNGRGRRILRKTLITVFEKPVASISSFRNDPHREGDPLELYCNTQGFPAPKISWMFNGKKRMTAHKLEIPSLKVTDAGIYQCFAENEVGISSTAVLVRVVPNMMNTTQITTDAPRSRKGILYPPSAPNVTQLSEDSASLSWSMPNITQDIQFFKVQYRDLGTKDDPLKSSWYTVDGNIDPPIRSFEVVGLIQNHVYRFRIAVVIDNDNTVGPVSKRFHLKESTEKGPAVIPQLLHILPLSTSSLSVQWTVPKVINADEQGSVEGYFIYFRDSLSAGPYSKITIFGPGTHSHVIENLKQGRRFDIKVRAFNVHGVGPFSPVQYARTLAPETKTKKEVVTAAVEAREPEDEDATLYLIIGCCLGVLVIILISVCSAVTIIKRRKMAKKYSETNAAIHNKYQDTSLQISGLQYQTEQDEYPQVCTRPTGHVIDSQFQMTYDSGDLETSFSVNDQSYGGDNSISSQGSTALAQDSSRNLTMRMNTLMNHPDYLGSVEDEVKKFSRKLL
ncbi:interference hedgehog [Eurytemora carolleeae]|uniref:interference hedgehog n=1 Tax=Eurytemora carolleeae TaxID=1294199 RepID=UPI000C776D40|nr:interference hedgehog [Eurytemora carolleeae]|eukprot:XP_023345081.1 interference hedgehog-like [Eurytemora affinis]